MQELPPLFKSVRSGNLDGVVAALATEDPSVVHWMLDNALHMAAKEGHYDIVELLLKDGRIDPNAVNKAGYTALHSALLLKHPRIVYLLLKDPRVDPTAPYIERGLKRSPLELADSRNKQLVNRLLEEPRVIKSLTADIKTRLGLDDPPNRITDAIARGAWRRRRAAIMAHAAHWDRQADPNYNAKQAAQEKARVAQAAEYEAEMLPIRKARAAENAESDAARAEAAAKSYANVTKKVDAARAAEISKNASQKKKTSQSKTKGGKRTICKNAIGGKGTRRNKRRI
jgi:ankyrin repeat protein